MKICKAARWVLPKRPSNGQSGGTWAAPECEAAAEKEFMSGLGVSEEMSQFLEVLVVDPLTNDVGAWKCAYDPKIWCRQGLKDRAEFSEIEYGNSTLVVSSVDRMEVLGLAVYECHMPALKGMGDRARDVAKVMKKSRIEVKRGKNGEKDNGCIRMEGIRYVPFQNPQLGRYKPRKGTTPEADERCSRMAAEMAAEVCAAERFAAPAAARARLAVKTLIAPFNGISPHVTQDHGALAGGSSIGYASPPHVDLGICTETVLFRGVHRYGFAFARAGIFVNLHGPSPNSPSGSVLVMVPAGDHHGTPYINPDDPTEKHEGVGFVVITKAKTCSKAAMRLFANMAPDPCYATKVVVAAKAAKDTAKAAKDTAKAAKDTAKATAKAAKAKTNHTTNSTEDATRHWKNCQMKLIRVLKQQGIPDAHMWRATPIKNTKTKGRKYVYEKYGNPDLGLFSSIRKARISACKEAA